jgi:hypothetical protein
MITFNLPPGLEWIMAEMASETGQTPEQIILDAVEERLSDFHETRIAEERLRNPTGPYIPLDEAIRELELREAEERRNKPAAE